MSTSIVAASLISSDATWRERVQFLSNLLDAAGMAKTADTGQINTATAVQPTSNNSSTAGGGGYEIRAFGDAGAAIRVKIEYGRASVQHAFSFWFTIGTGSDGAGNITGELYPRTQQSGNVGSADPAAFLYGSAGNNWFDFILGTATANSPRQRFHMSRSFDDNGDPTDVGVIVLEIPANTITKKFVFRTGAIQTVDATAVQQLNPPNTVTTDSLPDGNRAVIPVQVWDRTKLMPPSPNIAIGKDTGFVSLTEYNPIIVAGKTGNFKAFTFTNSYALGGRSSGLWNTHLIRWE